MRITERLTEEEVRTILGEIRKGVDIFLAEGINEEEMLEINNKKIHIFIGKEIAKDKSILKRAFSFVRENKDNYAVFSEIKRQQEELIIKDTFIESLIIKKENDKELIRSCVNSLIKKKLEEKEEDILYDYGFETLVCNFRLVDGILC
jgi:hypothetical protein